MPRKFASVPNNAYYNFSYYEDKVCVNGGEYGDVYSEYLFSDNKLITGDSWSGYINNYSYDAECKHPSAQKGNSTTYYVWEDDNLMKTYGDYWTTEFTYTEYENVLNINVIESLYYPFEIIEKYDTRIFSCLNSSKLPAIRKQTYQEAPDAPVCTDIYEYQYKFDNDLYPVEIIVSCNEQEREVYKITY